jgi:hypothetical protein
MFHGTVVHAVSFALTCKQKHSQFIEKASTQTPNIYGKSALLSAEL